MKMQGMDALMTRVRAVVTPLARSRIFLFSSLVLLGVAFGVTAATLQPDGLVRARMAGWGPRGRASSGEIVGYAADRAGGRCGVERSDGTSIELPRCHAYQAPEVVRVGSHMIVVWEEADRSVAVSALSPDLVLGRTVRLPRPETAAGVLLPRTGVAVEKGTVAIRYHRGRVVTVGPDLAPWPGGMWEVASARLGPRGGVLLGGLLGLLAFYFIAAGWRLFLPRSLERRRREGRCIELTLPERGCSLVVGGRAFELDVSNTWFFGVDASDRRRRDVTLVLREPLLGSQGGAYREHDRLRPLQIWAGRFEDVLARARAIRADTVAIAALATAVLLLALDGYLVL